MTRTELISEVYAAFVRGDIPYILDQLADNVQWNDTIDNSAQHADLPWMRLRQGREGVVKFFEDVAEMEIDRFEVLNVFENGDNVVARLVMHTKRYEITDELIHFWTIDNSGKITNYHQFIDTAKQIAARARVANSATA